MYFKIVPDLYLVWHFPLQLECGDLVKSAALLVSSWLPPSLVPPILPLLEVIV